MNEELLMPDDEIWDWYEKCEKQDELRLKPTAFCQKFDIDYKRYSNMRYRIMFKSRNDEKRYAELMKMVDKFEQGFMGKSAFVKEHKLPYSEFAAALTHARYLRAINRMKKEREAPKESPMEFIEMQLPATVPQQELEVIEPQNDLEIIISKGVKVCIAPNVDTMKVVKIIEFMKEL